MKYVLKFALVAMLAFYAPVLYAQEDTTTAEDEEDYSIYDDLDFADDGTQSFANAKISGLSPARFISLGYDYQAGYDLTAANVGEGIAPETATINSTSGIRVGANIPVVSRNDLLIQVGGQYWNLNYNYNDASTLNHPLHKTLANNGLRTWGLNSTIYKPLNETHFILVQLGADMNGDYAVPEFQSMRYNRYSIAALYGKRPSDYKQWALGISRTYRAGELNYVPIFYYNYTSPVSKWGIEALLPARGHVRYSFNKRSILMAGFELEGNSYRLGNQSTFLSEPLDDVELRRSEIRARMMYQRQLVGFVWFAAELGYRINYSYNVDDIPEGKDFTRLFGIVSDAPYVMENTIGNPVYFNISLNLVSP
ncbi:MAG: hypothetical protein KDC92_05050 [Bacteroidetes bacterium]|nr:hypothetical protein [Bacteroidota bacterium]